VGGLVADCTVQANTRYGISASDACIIRGCSVYSSGTDGIRVSSASLVLNNTCGLSGLSTPSGAGVHATSGDNRIEGNNCASADRGVPIDSAGNIIIRNTCTGNAINWVIQPGNVFGPIIDRTAPGSPFVSGSSAASTLGSTDANANFSF
jgi:parallel beta-helix repeat protein